MNQTMTQTEDIYIEGEKAYPIWRINVKWI
jgi:hypothetical protein